MKKKGLENLIDSPRRKSSQNVCPSSLDQLAMKSPSAAKELASSFNRLPTELHLMIVERMEYPSMISFMLVNHHFYRLVDHIRRRNVTLIENYAIREFLWRKQCRGCGEWKRRGAFPTFQPYCMSVDLWEQGFGPWVDARILRAMRKFCFDCHKIDDIMCGGNFSPQMLLVHWRAIKSMILGK
ncbi:MAG: hypothetical protein Q9173_003404 [Seirophora scorigena]